MSVSRKLRPEPKKPRPSSKLTELPSAAARREAAQYEDDNVGVEAANRTTQAAEGGARYAAKLSERPTRKTNAEPQGAKAQQKRGIKAAYSKARQGKSTTTATAKSAKKAAEKEKKTAQFIYRHRKGIGIAAALFIVAAFIMNALTSCSVFLQGGLSSVGITTFPSSAEDMLAAEAAYAAMEAELQAYLDSYEAAHDYDEYHMDIDDIEHDPYVLMSILTAWFGGEWTMDEAEAVLGTLFDRQYILTETVQTYGEGEDEYTVCTVTLENFDLSHLPVYLLTED
ncbi:MAG TPA: peptidase M23, partial [Candidatus Scatomorpha merdavium]|nr:peptidase M23 [Candidatus Scatomorpha merdavium]